MARIHVNGRPREVDADDDTPLLWVLRDHLGLTGTKYGCGEGLCGACTVIIDGKAQRSCLKALDDIEADQKIETIESLEKDGVLSAVQQAWLDHEVPQCGFCQSGVIMAVTALFRASPAPTAEDIGKAIRNICRCGTYQEMGAAIQAIRKS
jgi:isoquinoline 1-oxidoreductase alpha subunit